MKNIRNSIAKRKRGLNKSNLQILNEHVTSKKLRIALNNMTDIEFIELAVRLQELKK